MYVGLRIRVHDHGIHIVGRSNQWQEQDALLDHLSSEVPSFPKDWSNPLSGVPCSIRPISKGCGVDLMVLDPLRFPLCDR